MHAYFNMITYDNTVKMCFMCFDSLTFFPIFLGFTNKHGRVLTCAEVPSKRQDCRECLEDEMSEMAEKVVIEESESRLQLSS